MPSWISIAPTSPLMCQPEHVDGIVPGEGGSPRPHPVRTLCCTITRAAVGTTSTPAPSASFTKQPRSTTRAPELYTRTPWLTCSLTELWGYCGSGSNSGSSALSCAHISAQSSSHRPLSCPTAKSAAP
eukprot:scaffold10945_cov62-Phaeocystis_antarctica.AAC.3